MDRRIKKTRTLIKNYIVDCYSDNADAKLSISSLCEAIDINRSTFYLHYSSIDMVIKELEEDAIEVINSYIEKYGENYLALFQDLCNYVKENVNLFKALFSVGGDHFASLVYKRFYNIVKKSVLVKPLEDDPSKDYVITFIINGTIGIFKKWINENFKTKEIDIVLAFLKFLRLDEFLTAQ